MFSHQSWKDGGGDRALLGSHRGDRRESCPSPRGGDRHRCGPAKRRRESGSARRWLPASADGDRARALCAIIFAPSNRPAASLTVAPHRPGEENMEWARTVQTAGGSTRYAPTSWLRLVPVTHDEGAAVTESLLDAVQPAQVRSGGKRPLRSAPGSSQRTPRVTAHGSRTVWDCIAGAVPLLAALGACTPAERPAGPEPALVRRASAEYVFYDVGGDTPGRVWASMREGSANTLGTTRTFGRTEWEVTWRARWEGPGMCRVRSAEVQLTTRITLPRWVPPSDAPAELAALWNAFIRALSLHEARHADNAAAAARALRRELEAASAPSCGMMDGRTRTAASQVLEEYRERDRAYDERTRHGTTEGAVWPPRTAAEVPPP